MQKKNCKISLTKSSELFVKKKSTYTFAPNLYIRHLTIYYNNMILRQVIYFYLKISLAMNFKKKKERMSKALGTSRFKLSDESVSK